VLVGADAARIAAALNAVGFDDRVTVAGPIPAVVERAFRAARPGDVVLLSPVCSSVGEFRAYADSGAQFAAAVEALTSQEARPVTVVASGSAAPRALVVVAANDA
jgi:UDP-N-acetylmuramoylalanine--D-glutamate ligase